MSQYRNVMRIGTLLLGSLTFFLIAGPLGALVYLLIWFDTLFLFDAAFAKPMGIDLITTAALIAGVALGPVLGFIFGLLVFPGLVLLLVGIVNRFWMVEFIPSIDYLYAGIAALMAGLLGPFLPFLFAVTAALFQRYAVSSVINKSLYGSYRLDFAVVNIIVSLAVLFGLGSIGLVGT